MTEPNEIFIAYELWHVEEARSYAALGTTVVCLDFFVEQELKKKNIPYVSLREFVDSENGEDEWWLLAQTIAREWYRLPAMKFFEHDGIRLGEVIEPIMEQYLSKLFYYVRIYSALKKEYPNAHFTIPAIIIKDKPSDECLVSFEQRIATDAARIAGLRFDILGKLIESRTHPFFQTVGKSLLIRIYNSIISFIPRRSLTIYAGEYWSHIAPIIEQMDDVELVLMESGALAHTPWRQLLAHRVRIRHPHGAIRKADRRTAMRVSYAFMGQWKDAKESVEKYLVSRREEIDWSPVLEAYGYLMTYAARVIADIDAVRRIMEEEKPDVVLQLASVGSRHHHFFIMARVAAQLKVPSIELQHAAATVDPRQVYSRIETDYLATYGTYTAAWYERIGNARDKLIPVGSPRFDRYSRAHAHAREEGKRMLTQLGLDTERPVLFAAVPFSDTSLFLFDSYELADFFKAIRMAQDTVPGMQVLFKFRNNYAGAAREYLNELFPTDMKIAESADLFALLCASDAALCGFSTVLYEVLLVEKPLILTPWKKFDTYHAQVYESAAPLFYDTSEAVTCISRALTDESYRDDCLARQKQFLEGYSFDGKSSGRAAALLHETARHI